MVFIVNNAIKTEMTMEMTPNTSIIVLEFF